MNVALRFASAVFVAAALLAPAQAQDAPKKAPPAKRVAGPHSLRTYAVPGGNAEALAKLLQEIFPTPATRVAALGTHQIAVWADPDTHLEIAGQQPLQPASVEIIPLASNEDLKELVKRLKATFGDPKSGAPLIEADVESNSILVRGSAEQIAEARQAILSLERSAEAPGKMRILTIENGSAATVAEAIQLLFPKIRNNPINVTTAAKKSDPPKKDAKAPQTPPVNLVAFGNKLMISSENPEAMATVVSLVRMLLQPMPVGDFEVIRLQHAKAVHVAKVLDEAFNGKAGGERTERVRVVADAEANLLLMRARPLDAMTIRKLILESLDTPSDMPRKQGK